MFAQLSAAQAQPFDFTYGGDPGTEPGFVWHGGNAVKLAGDTLQVWVKVGYKDGATMWADHAEVRYKVTTAGAKSRSSQGVRALPSGPAIRAAVARLRISSRFCWQALRRTAGFMCRKFGRRWI